ncbi:hypothetical protein [Caballeronia glebae]|uniref:Pectate lyase superfamily protein n=1 Tax=Caballeronia glebae TaxID=1777143 RepID=A0A158DCL4_9BURK|nr:hypothetical protein [Caballeronia glebae]SAK92193.1 hypothetical protein AWB82_06580 [Caballeronia glebae]
MDRYWKSNTAPDAPAVPDTTAGGYPQDGIPASGVEGTVPGAWWYHSVTEEIRGAIEKLGGVPDWKKTDQLGTTIAGALATASDKAGQSLSTPNGAALVGFIQAGTDAATRTMQDKAREVVSVDDYYRPELGDADYTQAFERAIAYLSSRAGGVIECYGSVYIAETISVRRNIIIQGRGAAATVLQQAANANKDFVVSENFAALTGSGVDVARDTRVPSWFGLRAVRIDANRSGNSIGRAVAFYGAAQIIDDVLIEHGASGGLYTEYATNVASMTSWPMQEEGYIRNVISRENGGVGWVNRGPHNVYVDNFIACLNDDWGYYSETLAGKYSGAPTYATSLHCYSNDMQWRTSSGRARRNMCIGVNMSCGLLVVDGAQCEIRGSNSLIGIVKQYFGGQGGDSLVLSGSNIQIGSHYGIMRNDGVSSGFTSLRITGDYNEIGTSNISGTQQLFDGVAIQGVGNGIGYLIAQNCRTALSISGSRNRVDALLMNNLTALNYDTPTDGYSGYNTLRARIYQTSGSYISGDAPAADKDTFDIVANGMGGVIQRTACVLSVSALPIDTTSIQQANVAHNLIWPCRVRDVVLTMTGQTGSSTVAFAYWRVKSVDATNITIEYRCATAGPAGSQVSFGIQARVN